MKLKKITIPPFSDFFELEIVCLKLPRSTADVAIVNISEVRFDKYDSVIIDKMLYLLSCMVFELMKSKVMIFDVSKVSQVNEIVFDYVFSRFIRRRRNCYIVTGKEVGNIDNVIVSDSIEAAVKDLPVSFEKYFKNIYVDCASHDYIVNNSKSVSFDISDISYEASSWGEEIRGVCIKIVGKYRHGSGGEEDALKIKWALREVCTLLEPDMVVVDLTLLDYVWGDDISLYPSGFIEPDSPIKFVFADENKEALRGAVNKFQIASSVEGAICELNRMIMGG
ncbi:hypothetical protein HCH_03774 [Hahella chejuensis KCTC 2396]|uniref:Uncharacterized protein n=1 Tax=Hahella chejuensis (strain KCTC 2396) TaxID=349521 RepID=Q2SFR8_HAHCH|nr:hypothetical protein [Hahella chejuensis]ABC30506.1 hypothetical protein HCH_03774 [Hahella chejuensis KCTC 2396]